MKSKIEALPIWVQAFGVILFYPFMLIPLSIKTWNLRKGWIPIWYGVTLATAVVLPLVYILIQILENNIPIKLHPTEWEIIRSIAIIWSMVVGGLESSISFPNDDIGGGTFRMSSVAICSSGTAIFSIGISISFFSDNWIIGGLIAILGSVVIGGFWGALFGNYFGRMIRLYIGLAETEFEGIRILHGVQNCYGFTASSYQTFSPSIMKIISISFPVWIFGYSFHQIPFVEEIIYCSVIVWILYALLTSKKLIIYPEGIKLERNNGVFLTWNKIKFCRIDSNTYKLYFSIHKADESNNSTYYWNWIYASPMQQINVIAVLYSMLGGEKIELIPGPIPSRLIIKKQIETSKKNLNKGFLKVLPTLELAVNLSKELEEVDLFIESNILLSSVYLSQGAIGHAFEIAEATVSKAKEDKNPDLIAKSLINLAHLFLRVSPKLQSLRDIMEELKKLEIRDEVIISEIRQIFDISKMFESMGNECESFIIQFESIINRADIEENPLLRYSLYRQALIIYNKIKDENKLNDRLVQISYSWCQYQTEMKEQGKLLLKFILEKSIDENDVHGIILSLWRSSQIELIEENYEEAYSFLRRACNLIDTIHWASTKDWQKIAIFSNQRIQIYEEMVNLCLIMPKDVAEVLAISGYQRAFEYVERAKARALLDLIGYERIQFNSHDYMQNQSMNSNTFEEPVHSHGLRGYSKNYSINTKTIPRSDLQSMHSKASINLENLQNALLADRILLEYFTIKNKWFVFYVTHNDCKCIPLTLESLDNCDLNSVIHDFLALLSKRPLVSTEKIIRLAKVLNDALWAPIEDIIESKNIYIIPHGPLHALPFQALYRDGKWLIDDLDAIVYCPSASILVSTMGGDIPDEPQYVGLANPFNTQNEINIPEAINEIMGAQKYYPNSIIKPSVGNDYPSVSDFMEYAEKADILHFACHGHEDNDPLKSGFYLRNKNANNQIITVEKIFTVKIKARLVIASICYGSSGKLSGGDEWIGLLRSFLAVGAHSIIASRWEVDDRAANLLMLRLHKHLMDNQISGALMKALIDLKDQSSFSHPFYWANSSLWGEGISIRRIKYS